MAMSFEALRRSFGLLTWAVAENLEIILEQVVQWRRSPKGDSILIPFSLPKLLCINRHFPTVFSYLFTV